MTKAGAFIDGPFDPKLEPWLLRNQYRLGIAVQREIILRQHGERIVRFEQPHGYLRGGIGTGKHVTDGFESDVVVRPSGQGDIVSSA